MTPPHPAPMVAPIRAISRNLKWGWGGGVLTMFGGCVTMREVQIYFEKH